jgi:hypothetical protein
VSNYIENYSIFSLYNIIKLFYIYLSSTFIPYEILDTVFLLYKISSLSLKTCVNYKDDISLAIVNIN